MRTLAITLLAALGLAAQGRITTPKEQFGFHLGDDYQLANYVQLTSYWKKLDAESDRMKLVEIGKTAEGRPQWMAVITAPENFARLERYRDIARRLALAEGLTDDEARALAQEGKAVVWIDGGLHATETLGAQQLMELVYQMVSRDDPETQRFLKDVILLAVHANPDGHDLVADWYMREKDPTRREFTGIPRLYQKYVGHDNNRDFYMLAMPESANMARVLFQEWNPQIMYNHHQTGPVGVVLFAPPFRDPANYNIDPLVVAGLDLVGAAMHNRFLVEGKPGATTRKGATYSTWFNGGLRTTTYFHNMIGLLTETQGSPTPIEIPFLPERQLPSSDLFFPIAPQKWHFRQSVEYSITANRAVLDIASRHREQFLFNIYRMGKNSIDRGSRDHWTVTPKRIDAVRAALARDNQQADQTPAFMRGRGPRAAGVPLKYFQNLRDPALRDPRGFILPSDQPDFPTAIKFLNALIKANITVHRATGPFEAAGKRYPAGSFAVKTAQAFRPHVLDMFEPQDHPNDFLYPGGPPVPPYDNAGYTLALQMGVAFDRVLDGFDAPLEKVSGLIKPPAGKVTNSTGAAGWLLSHRSNDSFIAVNRLLKNKEQVSWIQEPQTVDGKSLGPGAMFIPAGASTATLLRAISAELGLDFHAVAKRPAGRSLQLRPVRVALWDNYGGSMPSGWIRWLLEQFEFPFEVVYPQTIDAGNFGAKFDVLILPDGAYRSSEPRRGPAPNPDRIPAEFRDRLGSITDEKTVPQLRKWMSEGGVTLAIGSATRMVSALGLPLQDALTERAPTGKDQPLPREKFYIPTSVLRARVASSHPLAWGIPEEVNVTFDNSPVYKTSPDAPLRGLHPVAWFADEEPLRSGWAWGQHYLRGGVAVAEAAIGEGKFYLFGPEITFRAQPHGTFKFLFNGIFLARAQRSGD